MAEMSGDGLSEGRLDLVPMIDCIMLLLLFFMMTTKFTPEEKVVQNLLPTNVGTGPGKPSTEPPQFIYVNIYPAGLTKATQSEQEFQKLFDALTQNGAKPLIEVAEFRVSNRDKKVQLSVKELASRDPGSFTPQITRIHSFIAEELAALESAGKDRKDQKAVVIQCFSSLSWQFALVAYDAVRSYEMKMQPDLKPPFKPEMLLKARDVNFSPPRLRNFKKWELGNELYEILHSQ